MRETYYNRHLLVEVLRALTARTSEEKIYWSKAPTGDGIWYQIQNLRTSLRCRDFEFLYIPPDRYIVYPQDRGSFMKINIAAKDLFVELETLRAAAEISIERADALLLSMTRELDCMK